VADYKFIGGDGGEYGPYSARQMRQFMVENRLAATSQVSMDGGPFQPASNFPELVGGQPQTTVPQQYQPMPGQPMHVQPIDAKQQVNGPGLFMLITAGLSIAAAIVNLIAIIFLNTALVGGGMQTEGQAIIGIITGVPNTVISIIAGIFIMIGAIKMRKLESYGLAMTASILSILCCPCCVGIGAGIWSLVVLNNEQVKAAFAANRV